MTSAKKAKRTKASNASANTAATGSAQTTASARQIAVPASAGARSLRVVGIGASAGGLEAFEQFFKEMRSDSGMAFVLVQHLDPKRTSLMPELLQRLTAMKVVQAKNRARVQPNCVYLIPPNRDMIIVNGTLRLIPPVMSHGVHLPIDIFFRSLAEDQRERAIGIILSGNGTDGTLGVKAIKEELGMVMAQDMNSAKYNGMPSSAIDTGLVDYVLPPDKMPAQLVNYAQRSTIWSGTRAASVVGRAPDALHKIFQILRTQTGHDFSLYKKNTICRRIERRMNVHQIEDASTYLRFLQENPQEAGALFRELLIGVTNFFRDPEAFKALGRKWLPKLLAAKPREYTVRLWIPGCSTGEEVYSTAIVLRECLDQLKRGYQVQIFGTDIDERAIETARLGVYPRNIAADVSPQRLKRFFFKDGDGYRIRKDIREMVVFAPQNIIKDPPFVKLDLLCCRNLLIYLDPGLQKRLFPLFHYTLKPGGLLFLGSSESIGGFQDYFAALDKKWKIYRRKETAVTAPALVDLSPLAPARMTGKVAVTESKRGGPGALADGVTRLLLNEYSPASVVVNEKGDILYIHGRTGKYLEPAAGQANLNVVEMAREGLKFELSAAIRKAHRQDKDVRLAGLRVQANGRSQAVNLTVKRLQQPENLRGLLLVVFEETEPPQTVEAAKARSQPRRRAAKLEEELKYTREHLQTTVEELETSNEELKSTNEELQSTNEELQSTNEELETSKEEMHSLNEELVTVNTELQSKVEQLTQTRDDMKNLLDGTKIATLFLDNNLCVKRFTAEANRMTNLIPSDVGRPIGHITSNLKHETLVQDAEQVLDTLVFKEVKVQSRDGQWFLMRIMPYRTIENVIDGVVITFVDIDDLQQQILTVERDHNVHRVAEALYQFATGVAKTAREPLLVLDAELRVVAASGSFYETFRIDASGIEGFLIYELSAGAWNIPRLRELLEEIIPQNSHFEDFEVEHDFPVLGRRRLLLSARRISYDVSLVLLAIEDVTERV